jgi:hypothetical protein
MAKVESVTLWYKRIQVEIGPGDIEEKWDFNHLENRIVDSTQQRPLPIKPEFKEQAKEWKHGTWAKQPAVLYNGKVVPVMDSLIIVDNEGKISEYKEITTENDYDKIYI